MPVTLRETLDRFAAASGHRPVTQILAVAARDHLQVVGSAPRPPSPRRRRPVKPGAIWWTKY